MQHFHFICLVMLLLLGCADQVAEPPEDVGDQSQSIVPEKSPSDSNEPEEAEFQVPKEFPGMQGIGGIRAKSARNSLYMIGLACHSYHETINTYPFPAGRVFRPERKNKLSWRVHFLWGLEARDLADQFKMDQSWDSDHNLALLEKMPDAFKLLGQDTKPCYTQIMAPSGEGFIVDGENNRRRRDITDDPATTILLVTVKPEKAVPWTDPAEFKIDLSQPGEILGGDPNGFLAFFADGSTKTLDPNMDPETLKALFTIAGGEAIDKSKLPPNDFPPFGRELYDNSSIPRRSEKE